MAHFDTHSMRLVAVLIHGGSLGMEVVQSLTPMSCRFGHGKIPAAIVPSLQIQDVQFSLCSVVSYWKKDVPEVLVNSQAYRGTVCRELTLPA